jgi:hypothetical protein
MGWDVIGRLLWVMSTSRDPVRARARIGHWALAARTMPEADRRKVLEAARRRLARHGAQGDRRGRADRRARGV